MKKILDTKYRKQENEYKLQKICSHPFKLKFLFIYMALFIPRASQSASQQRKNT